ncbi:MAG: carboxypeptidase-like regulatory domain-containing protein [Planctomycetes bacterium]|nr:carboxypeptidase-like regulatory domain-containing protein [Planctomycetota bacterium]
MNKSFRVWCGLWLCLAGLLLGCTSGSSGTVGVSGKVTKGGQPVSGALVAFRSTSAAGKAASGTTDASGEYKLTTFINGDGALPGSYQVTVTKFAGAAPPSVTGGTEATPADVDAIYKAMEAQGQNVLTPEKLAPVDTRNEIAAKFANPQTSGFTAEVKSGGDNKFDFEVTDK